MPMSAPKPCAHPGCPALVRDGTSRCSAHKVVAGTFADRNRGSSQARGYGTEWRRVRDLVMVRDAGLCQPCLKAGALTVAQEVDHIVNKSEGGSDDPNNLQAICKPCHVKKTAQEAGRGRQGRSTRRPW